jgi:nitroimidazol reductase NimA-like FMN-containing flavoprotein (pyridoxamine 5'-phosphate oxidase superfamily)
MDGNAPSARTRIRRLPEQAVYDSAAINAIVDEALICHVGFVDHESPVVIPTIHARSGDLLYLHGSPASRMMRNLKQGVEVCVTITLVDGLVMARAPFHSSMNYRSVVIFGSARLVDDPDEKWEAFRLITEHVAPGRWLDSRRPTATETRATSILALPMAEASAKVSTGPPEDDEEDYSLPLWAGVVPLRLVAEDPVDDPDLRGEIAVPDYLREYGRPGWS